MVKSESAERLRMRRTFGQRPHPREGSSPNAAGLVGPDRDLDAVARTDLGHEAGDVALHRAEADLELVGDLGVGSPAGDGQEDLLFAVGEGLARLRWRELGLSVCERREQSRSDAGSD